MYILSQTILHIRFKQNADKWRLKKYLSVNNADYANLR